MVQDAKMPAAMVAAAPFSYAWSPPTFGWDAYVWQADTLLRALICSLVEAVLFIGTTHAVEGPAFL